MTRFDRNSRNPSEEPRTLTIVKINKGPTAPNIGPKRMVLNARCLAKPDAAPTLYAEAINRGTTFIRRLFCFGVMVEYDNPVTSELPRGLCYGEERSSWLANWWWCCYDLKELEG